jgi:predicted ester cyclase
MEDNLLNTARQIVEGGFGKADLSMIDNYIADDFVEHQFGMQGGKEGLKKAIQGLHNAFPDMHYNVINHCVNSDIVWTHFQCMGTHTGAFMGNPATGKSFTIDVIDIMRFANGKMVEHWGSPDRFALLVQLGFWPPKK